MENYISTAEYAELYGLAQVTVKQRCARGKMPGAIKVGTYPHQIWLIPKDADFTDSRVKTGKYIGAKRARKKEQNEDHE